jgi:hypothetical protein
LARTKRMVKRRTASQIASASAASFLLRLEGDQGAGQAFRIDDAMVSLNEPAALAACGGHHCNRLPTAQKGEEDRRNPIRQCFLEVLPAIVFTPTDRL